MKTITEYEARKPKIQFSVKCLIGLHNWDVDHVETCSYTYVVKRCQRCGIIKEMF